MILNEGDSIVTPARVYVVMRVTTKANGELLYVFKDEPEKVYHESDLREPNFPEILLIRKRQP